MGNSDHGTTYTYTASSVDLMETQMSAIAAKGTTNSRRGQGLRLGAETELGCQDIPLLTQRAEVRMHGLGLGAEAETLPHTTKF